MSPHSDRERGSTERWWQESNTKRNSTISRTTAVQKQVRAPHFQRPQGREGELQREPRTPVGQAGEGASRPLLPLLAHLARVHLCFTVSGVVMKEGDQVPLN